MTRAPARAIAAIPAIHAASNSRNSDPTLTPPSAANSIPVSDVRMDAGIASTSVSTLTASHGSGSTACRHLAIPDLPELDPPFNTIT
ncbi:hypothetical protein GCM10029978_008950 [Actinoallomurus acanthiterrae]